MSRKNSASWLYLVVFETTLCIFHPLQKKKHSSFAPTLVCSELPLEIFIRWNVSRPERGLVEWLPYTLHLRALKLNKHERRSFCKETVVSSFRPADGNIKTWLILQIARLKTRTYLILYERWMMRMKTTGLFSLLPGWKLVQRLSTIFLCAFEGYWCGRKPAAKRDNLPPFCLVCGQQLHQRSRFAADQLWIRVSCFEARWKRDTYSSIWKRMVSSVKECSCISTSA